MNHIIKPLAYSLVQRYTFTSSLLIQLLRVDIQHRSNCVQWRVYGVCEERHLLKAVWLESHVTTCQQKPWDEMVPLSLKIIATEEWKLGGGGVTAFYTLWKFALRGTETTVIDEREKTCGRKSITPENTSTKALIRESEAFIQTGSLIPTLSLPECIGVGNAWRSFLEEGVCQHWEQCQHCEVLKEPHFIFWFLSRYWYSRNAVSETAYCIG